ncbi:MAG TPA: DUF4159 domain-containing protein [Candidatus Handelsmanbacteria bacterium]|nr:DUF4159 domain-containing protein [Candidatus Handelsmanbacteria bacterium]
MMIDQQLMRTLLLIALLCAPALAQENRPTLSIPEPTRQRSTPLPTSDASFTVIQVDYNDARKERDYLSLAAQELVQFTKIAAKLEVKLNWREEPLDNRRIMDALMLYMTGYDGVMRINDMEKKNLAEYLKKGGLLFADDILPLESDPRQSAGIIGTPFDRQFKALIKDPLVLGREGARWRKLPKTHPLYSAYFDFPDGPPLSGARQGNVFALEGVELRGRLAVVFSDLNISHFWGDLNADGRDRSLQFGSNLIVFALTQKYAGRPLPIGR